MLGLLRPESINGLRRVVTLHTTHASMLVDPGGRGSKQGKSLSARYTMAVQLPRMMRNGDDTDGLGHMGDDGMDVVGRS